MITSSLKKAGVCALIALLAVLGTAGASAATLKIATISPDGSAWMKALRNAGAEVQKATEGRVKLKFYPGGVMGDDKAVLRKMRIGQLHGAVLTVGVLSQTYRDLQIYGLPMVFRDAAEVDHVRAKMDPVLIDGLRDKGFESFGIAGVGFAYAMSQNPIRTVDDARAQKVWVPDGDIAAERALAAFSVGPIPLAITDVLGGLQTGLINAVAAPPVGAIALQWHTRLKHVLDLPLVYACGTLVVGSKPFGKLTQADAETVTRILTAALADVDRASKEDGAKALAALKKQGLSFAAVTSEERAVWQSQADAAHEKMLRENVVSAGAWSRLQSLLSEIR